MQCRCGIFPSCSQRAMDEGVCSCMSVSFFPVTNGRLAGWDARSYGVRSSSRPVYERWMCGSQRVVFILLVGGGAGWSGRRRIGG